MFFARHLLEALPLHFRGPIPCSGCHDLFMALPMRHSNHPKPFLGKTWLPDSATPSCQKSHPKSRHASKVPLANLKAYRDEGRLPSILFEPGMENLLLEDTGRSSSSCIMECRTDFAEPTGKDEQCKCWIGAHQRMLSNKHRESQSCQAASELRFVFFCCLFCYTVHFKRTKLSLESV